MSKVPIQVARYIIRKPKNEAMQILCSYVSSNASDFMNGEEIVLKYLSSNDKLESVTVFVNDAINGDLSFVIGESDTMKIIESPTEPEDKNVLWLSDFSEEDIDYGNARNFKEELDFLKKRIKELKSVVEKHEYAFDNAMTGGNIKVNDFKYSLANSAKQEMPETPGIENYDTGNTEIEEIKVYVGRHEIQEEDILFLNQKYYLSIRAFNSDNLDVDIEDGVITYVFTSEGVVEEIVVIENECIVNPIGTGTTVLNAKLLINDAIYEKQFEIKFENFQEPDYYPEPNYHQHATKWAKDMEELTQYAENLALYEFCWCVKENSLYYRAKAANGTVQLFKINGGGVTPIVEIVIYDVDENDNFIINSETQSVGVTEEGILNLSGTIDENGILHLNNK